MPYPDTPKVRTQMNANTATDPKPQAHDYDLRDGIAPDHPAWDRYATRFAGWYYLDQHDDFWASIPYVDPVTGEEKKRRIHVERWYVAIKTCYGTVVVFRKYRHQGSYLWGDSRNDAKPVDVIGLDGTVIPGRDRGARAQRRKPTDRNYVVGEIARLCFAGNRDVADLFMQTCGL